MAITLAIYTGISLALYAWLMRSWPGIEDVFGLGQTVGYGKYRRLLQNYGPLLPGNPAELRWGLCMARKKTAVASWNSSIMRQSGGC